MSEQTLQELVREIIADVMVGTYGIQPRAIEHTRMTIQNRIEKWLAKQAAPASQPGVNADQLRQASEQAFMNIPDPHTSSAHFNEMARLLNAALAAVPQPAAAPAEPPNGRQCWYGNNVVCPYSGRKNEAAQRDRELIERGVRVGIDEARDAITQAQGYLHAAAFLAIQELNPAAIAEKVPNE